MSPPDEQRLEDLPTEIQPVQRIRLSNRYTLVRFEDDSLSIRSKDTEEGIFLSRPDIIRLAGLLRVIPFDGASPNKNSFPTIFQPLFEEGFKITTNPPIIKIRLEPDSPSLTFLQGDIKLTLSDTECLTLHQCFDRWQIHRVPSNRIEYVASIKKESGAIIVPAINPAKNQMYEVSYEIAKISPPQKD